jgi:putative transposase
MKMWEVTPGHGNVSVETTQRVVSTKTKTTLQRDSLGAIIGQFKSKCTKRIHAAGFAEFSWQARFRDHIVRDVSDLDRIRQYILDNPANWSKDDNYSRNIRMDSLHRWENQL